MENSGEGSVGCVGHVDVHDSVFVCVLPVIFKGRLPFFVLQVVLLILHPFLADITHTALLVKSSTSMSISARK